MSGQLMQEKHGHDELKSEIISAVPTPKHPPLLMMLNHRFGGKGAVLTPLALVSSEIIYTITLNLLNFVSISLRTSPFFFTESAPGISLRCFNVETPLLKLSPGQSLSDPIGLEC